MIFLKERASKFLVLFFLFTCSAIPSNCYAQNSGSLSVGFSPPGTPKGSSYGDKVLKYNGYSLKELLVNIYNGYNYEVQSDSLAKRKFDFKWEGSLENRLGIIEDLNYALGLNLNIEVRSLKEIPDVYFLSYTGASGCAEGVGTTISKINRVWRGTCVSLEELGKQMEEWYSINTEVSTEAVIPKIELHHDELEIFLLYLQKMDIEMDVKKTSKIKFIYK